MQEAEERLRERLSGSTRKASPKRTSRHKDSSVSEESDRQSGEPEPSFFKHCTSLAERRKRAAARYYRDTGPFERDVSDRDVLPDAAGSSSTQPRVVFGPIESTGDEGDPQSKLEHAPTEIGDVECGTILGSDHEGPGSVHSRATEVVGDADAQPPGTRTPSPCSPGAEWDNDL